MQNTDGRPAEFRPLFIFCSMDQMDGEWRATLTASRHPATHLRRRRLWYDEVPVAAIECPRALFLTLSGLRAERKTGFPLELSPERAAAIFRNIPLPPECLEPVVREVGLARDAYDAVSAWATACGQEPRAEWLEAAAQAVPPELAEDARSRPNWREAA